MGLSNTIQGFVPTLLILGTIFGTVLNAVLGHLIRRRTRKRAGERVFFTLVVAGVVFNFAPLCSTALQMLVRRRLPTVCPALEFVSLLALGVIPSLLLHTFLAFYRPRWLKGYWAILLYLPVLTVLRPAFEVLNNPEATFLVNLGRSTLTFVLWGMLACLATAFTTFALSGEAGREKEAVFNETLGYTLLALGLTLALAALLTNVREVPVLGPLTAVATLLSPNVLALIFAYSVYRYNYLGYFMKESLFHTVLASFALSIYFFGIRYIGDYLERSYGLDFKVLEAALVLGLLFTFNPVKQAVERLANRLFFERFLHPRVLLQNLSAEFNAPSLPNLPYLMDRTSLTLKEVFASEMAAVRLVGMEDLAAVLGNPGQGPLPQEIIVWMRANPNRVLDLYDVASPEIAKIMQDNRISALIPLAKNSELIGAIQLGYREVESALLPEERDLLLLLANQVTMVLEKYQILDQKIQLERKVLETEKLSSLGRLAASVAHEIKNPLSSIKAIIQTAREDVGGKGPLSDDLAVVVEEIDRLTETVNRLLNFIKPELSPQKLVPVEGILEGVLDILHHEAQKRHVTFVKEFSAESHYIRGRAEDLKSIMFNLVLNGLEAMPEGGTLTVCSSSRKSDENAPGSRGRKWAIVEVADTGVGIPPERLGAIFEPFHSSKESGTGLGLAIVKQKLEELGGKISVVSDKGTRFTLELPVLGRA
ncbi:MAG: hypothetical protein HY815_16585 [Candidatus Riflebacteria bacterium]|nr:hypothetical protein [Candidatus Riflebacteria bacterium]